MQQTHTKPPQALNLHNAQIYEITPFTMLDFADHIAAIVWFCGCNMRCIYCY
ncbi:MAG: anaerobic ribonucleoside-triphosphate reductase activating protein, partial [Campylobacter sp.]|nr:anaerobic ribonucleoside-triphosphate reductase activating protein [Campylobacter sp.]